VAERELKDVFRLAKLRFFRGNHVDLQNAVSVAMNGTAETTA